MKINFKVDKSLISYFFVALIGVGTQLVVSSASQKMFNLTYISSIGLGYFIAFLTTFFLINRYSFTSDNNGKIRNRILKYIIVSLFSGLITVYGSGICLLSLQKITGMDTIPFYVSDKEIDTFKLFSHFFGMGASFVFNYVSHKTFTFKKTDLFNRFLTRFFSRADQDKEA
ncbi:GtrA family protein [Emticicia sp. CRIBPO]|uniref:GtrA family protein n=1 Tax=Emticicia sp. CRIBPO TaxID=2683258 RepID=UPI00141376C5|nr:GtrA family protein [Emticicia sp. CRIBPO]NBA85149.1 GtrA family protein [Emticicia sp. CRIBPO]